LTRDSDDDVERISPQITGARFCATPTASGHPRRRRYFCALCYSCGDHCYAVSLRLQLEPCNVWAGHSLEERYHNSFVFQVLRTHTHTHTHTFKGPLSGTTRVSRYQKGKTNLDFNEARDSEWQWHQLCSIQVCTSLQTDNHASTPPLSFLQAGCPSCRPTNSVIALKARSKY